MKAIWRLRVCCKVTHTENEGRKNQTGQQSDVAHACPHGTAMPSHTATHQVQTETCTCCACCWAQRPTPLHAARKAGVLQVDCNTMYMASLWLEAASRGWGQGPGAPYTQHTRRPINNKPTNQPPSPLNLHLTQDPPVCPATSCLQPQTEGGACRLEHSR